MGVVSFFESKAHTHTYIYIYEEREERERVGRGIYIYMKREKRERERREGEGGRGKKIKACYEKRGNTYASLLAPMKPPNPIERAPAISSAKPPRTTTFVSPR